MEKLTPEQIDMLVGAFLCFKDAWRLHDDDSSAANVRQGIALFEKFIESTEKPVAKKAK